VSDVSCGDSTERFLTGNEYVSLAGVSAVTGALNGIGFVHSGFRGCIEVKGPENSSFLEPLIEVDGRGVSCDDVTGELLEFWVPRMQCLFDGLEVTHTIFAPVERRGLVCVLTARNTSEDAVRHVRFGFRAAWGRSGVTTRLSKPMFGSSFAYPSELDPQSPVFEFRGHVPLFALAFTPGFSVTTTTIDSGLDAETSVSGGAEALSHATRPLTVDMVSELDLNPGESIELPLYVGIASKEVSAIACAREMKMQGWDRLLSHLRSWLKSRRIDCEDDALANALNTSSFACYFGTQAITLDTEEYVLTSSRYSKNDTCGTYLDSDAMLWALPAVLQIDPFQARKLLVCALTCQLANVGAGCRFIDGVLLEPGLGLDRLCAPVIALQQYVLATDDLSILYDRRIQTGINTIQGVLAAQRHPQIPLFETLLTPSGDFARQSYLCYSNAIVWQALLALADMYRRIHDPDRSQEALVLAQDVRAAHRQHFTTSGPFGEMFAFSTDLDGNVELGDDPRGSIELLADIGICSDSDAAYSNTLLWLQSEHNPQQSLRAYEIGTLSGESGSLPSISLINDLRTRDKSKALAFLAQSAGGSSGGYRLKHSAPCPSLYTRPSASMAGWFAYALRCALGVRTPADRRRKLHPSTMDALYHPPPTVNFDSRKSRL